MPTRLHIERTLKRITIAVTAIIYCIRRIVVVSGCIGAISGYNVNSENRIYSKSKFLPRKTHIHIHTNVNAWTYSYIEYLFA